MTQQQLKTKLLSLGGSSVKFDQNSIEAIKRGFFDNAQEYSTVNLKTVTGQLGACHENTAQLCHLFGYKHIFGFGLANNVWAPHSWAWDAKIIETVEIREKYFGGVLPKKLCEQFLQ